MQSLIDSRPSAQQPSFRIARQARFGRAPRVLPAQPVASKASRRRTDVEKSFEDLFTRAAHLQRFRAVRDAIHKLGGVTQRTCRSYATFSDKSGNQFAVVKPLSDGGMRIGVGDFEGIEEMLTEQASGLGGSSRINHQFELQSHQPISGQQIGLLRRAFNESDAE